MIEDSNATASRFNEGRAAHRAGDLETAARLYREVLSEEPRHAEALHALGNVSARRGRLDEAEKCIRSALAIDPQGNGYHGSLGDVLAAQSRPDEAVSEYESELALRPDSVIVRNQLGLAHLAAGRVERAIECFEASLQQSPEFAVAANNLGRALNQARRYREAAEAFGKAVQLAPDMAQAHANLGHVLHLMGAGEEAAKAFDRALGLDDALPSAHRGLGLLLASRGQLRLAVQHFRQALERNPRDARTLRALGDVYLAESLTEQAAEHYERALEERPDDPDLLCALANARRAVGRQDDAQGLYRRALARRASHPTALAGLATLLSERGDAKSAVSRLAPSINSGRATPELLATYATLLGGLGRRREGIALLEAALQKKLDDRTAARLHFALASLLDGDGSYDLAFYHCRRGNALSHVRFDTQSFAALIDGIVASQGTDSLARLPAPDPIEPAPLFLIGLPRSGLAVLASVLSEHPEVCNAGASPRVEMGVHALWRHHGTAWPDVPTGAGVEAMTRLAREIHTLRGAASAPAGVPLDATWRNYLYLGVLHRLFPNARFVECVRDARDIALSCYFRDVVGGSDLPFSYSLDSIAAVVNGYRTLMGHWRATLPVAVHSVEYERLVLDPEDTCASLAAFLGIDADAGGFAAAGGDAGKSLRAKSLRRYRHYRDHLDGFVEALDAPPGETR